MDSKFKILFAVLISFTFFSCSSPTDSSNNSVAGNYGYTAYNSRGKVITSGSFTINFKNRKNIYGGWHFEKVAGNENIGPQYGDGKFIGEIVEKEIRIELNPNYIDNNVSLSGSINSGDLRGVWTYSTNIGLTNQGYFEAAKIN